jgi:hypothetical protein
MAGQGLGVEIGVRPERLREHLARLGVRMRSSSASEIVAPTAARISSVISDWTAKMSSRSRG